ncbi:NtaA/DmoA family FMN-dependent monooxygenase [Gulosibacter chungangensis]|uniref:NtaA/DmoA family FMN-dependent monooxygenase n=1 Tax=Gulosibacter chungangensis TaxID=979746 RepID=A0A7J5BCU4_9MICO|nr:NtaA/DmoA family FMN-dependent monooxygenase [Gulosibacter chungangensis]KAB1644001.1 NtaA/DmoA family FMN-dependent monooxygenase [Gulosibacter chungangensis]
MTQHRQIHFAAHFPGVNQQTVWSHPEAGSQIEFESFRRFAQIAEAGFMDYVFLAEGLRLREQKGKLHELDVAGRPNTVGVLSALAAVTEHIGLVGTLSATFNEPADIARQLQTLNVLSNGRAGWNVVTTSNEFTGANFRRGFYLPLEERYPRAQAMVDAARRIWGTKPGDREHLVAEHGGLLDFETTGTVPSAPGEYPVFVQAGMSPQGRDFAVTNSDIIFSHYGGFEAARAFRADISERLAAKGRAADDLKVMPAMTIVLGDTEVEAKERALEIRRAQVSPQTAISYVEQVWGRDLSDYDPDGPLPTVEPIEAKAAEGWVNTYDDRFERVAKWRELAERENLSIRDIAVREYTRDEFVGTPEQVADTLIQAVDGRAADGFTLVGHLVPEGLKDIVERVIPILQERGAYRTEYPQNANLRELMDTTAAPLEQLEPAGTSA